MDPLLFLRALRARFKVFALAFGITLATALLVSVLMPRTYRATASLVVDTRQEQSLTLSNALDALAVPRERTAYLQTQVDIITSPTVARRVVNKMQLADRPELIEKYEESGPDGVSIEDWIASMLLEDLDVETTQSSVVHLSYLSEDAQDATGTANAFAEAYMETMLELRVEPTRHAATWFDQQLTTLRADLQESQARMTDFQQEHGIVSADESQDDTYARFEDLSVQLLRAQEHAVESEVAASSARRAIESGQSIDDLPQILTSDYLRDLDAQLLEGEARLDALATQYGRNHPEYEGLLAENRARRQKRDSEALRVLGSAERNAEQAWLRVAEIEKLLALQRERLLDLKGSRDTLSLLKRNVDTAQNAYDTAMQRYVVSQVESRASQTNVALLSSAVTPSNPYRPNLLLNLALAVCVGTMLGGGLVMLAEMSDRRIRSPLDLGLVAPMPMLGELTGWLPSKHAALPHLRDSDESGK